jgi:hypothetical protein
MKLNLNSTLNTQDSDNNSLNTIITTIDDHYKYLMSL